MEGPQWYPLYMIVSARCLAASTVIFSCMACVLLVARVGASDCVRIVSLAGKQQKGGLAFALTPFDFLGAPGLIRTGDLRIRSLKN
jgi:hypothetical protein